MVTVVTSRTSTTTPAHDGKFAFSVRDEETFGGDADQDGGKSERSGWSCGWIVEAVEVDGGLDRLLVRKEDTRAPSDAAPRVAHIAFAHGSCRLLPERVVVCLLCRATVP